MRATLQTKHLINQIGFWERESTRERQIEKWDYWEGHLSCTPPQPPRLKGPDSFLWRTGCTTHMLSSKLRLIQPIGGGSSDWSGVETHHITAIMGCTAWYGLIPIAHQSRGNILSHTHTHAAPSLFFMQRGHQKLQCLTFKPKLGLRLVNNVVLSWSRYYVCGLLVEAELIYLRLLDSVRTLSP